MYVREMVRERIEQKMLEKEGCSSLWAMLCIRRLVYNLVLNMEEAVDIREGKPKPRNTEA